MWIDASLDWLLFWRSNFIMIRFGSPERDYSLSNGDMTFEKGLRTFAPKSSHAQIFSKLSLQVENDKIRLKT